MTIGQDMTEVIAKTLSPKGRVVSPVELWKAVSDGEEVHSHRFHRYRSVLTELVRGRQVEVRKDGDTIKGFAWIGKKFKH